MASPEHSSTPVSGEGQSSQDQSPESSTPASRNSSRPPKKRGRIHWQPEGESMDTKKQKSTFNVRDHSSPPTDEPSKPLPKATRGVSNHTRSGSVSPKSRSSISHEISEALKNLPAPKPSVLKRSSSDVSEIDVNGLDGVVEEDDDNIDEQAYGKAMAERTALSKAQRLSRDLGIKSAPGSQLPSPAVSPPPSPSGSDQPPLNLEDIPLERLTTRRQKYGIEDDTDSEESDGQTRKKKRSRFHNAAKRLIRRHTGKDAGFNLFRIPAAASSHTSLHSGQTTPEHNRDYEHYVPRPKAYNEGILSSLLKLYNEQGVGAAPSSQHVQSLNHNFSASKDSLLGAGNKCPTPSSGVATPASRAASGQATPKHQKWYYKDQSPSATPSIANLVSSSRSLAQPTAAPLTKAEESTPAVQGKKAGMRPQPVKRNSSQRLSTMFTMAKTPKPSDDEFKVHLHVADVLKRHQYLLKLCKALMSYGAPTHRLEEYMRMSARVLEVEGQFLYIPGCMIISFDDSGTHTTEVRIVRTAQGVHLGKLRDAHEIYKEVVHDLIDLDEAMARLDQVVKAKNKYPPWFLVFVYGLASACVGPFAFGARPIDLPIAFFLGCLLGIMQLIIAPKSELYSNIFEITAAVLTSFLARAFGSIRNGEIFCFSALAQSAIALILPGYIVRKSSSPTSQMSYFLDAMLTSISLRLARAPIPQYRRRLRPHGLRSHLLPLPRLRYHHRNLLLRRHLLQRDLRHRLPHHQPVLVPIHLRPALHPLPHRHQPGQIQADARHARHRFRRICRQPLLRAPLQVECPNRKHPRCARGRCLGESIFPPPSRSRGRGSLTRDLRPSALRPRGLGESSLWRHFGESNHESDCEWDAAAWYNDCEWGLRGRCGRCE